MSDKKDDIVLENLKNLFEGVYNKERSESYRDIFREVFYLTSIDWEELKN